jgi:hypothetical protein
MFTVGGSLQFHILAAYRLNLTVSKDTVDKSAPPEFHLVTMAEIKVCHGEPSEHLKIVR